MEPRIIYDRVFDDKHIVSVQPAGVCSSQIDIVIVGDTIEDVQYTGGCMGNSQGVAALLGGMKVVEAIARLDGIDCHYKGTSCPDQLAKALKMIMLK